MIREKTDLCASVISVFFDKITPNGICVALRSVGEFSHVLFQAHRALSCLPQISKICTDVFPCIQLSACERSVLIRRAGGASKPSSRQRSKSKGSVKKPIREHR